METLSETLLKNYCNSAKRILTMADVGSMGGISPLWESIADYTQIIGFEPDEREFVRLSNSEGQVHHAVALADQVKPLTLYVTQDVGKTSLFRPNFSFLEHFPNVERFKVIDEVQLNEANVQTLDGLVADEKITNIDFVKLDIQGSELAVLQGGKRTIQSSVLAIQVEVEFAEVYSGQPLFSEVDMFLRHSGFDLMDLDRIYWKRKHYRGFEGRGQLIYADAIYLRNPDSVMQILAEYPQPTSRIAGLAAIACLYGFHDYAVVIIDRYISSGASESESLEALKRIVFEHDESFGDWSNGDRRLGNAPN